MGGGGKKKKKEKKLVRKEGRKGKCIEVMKVKRKEHISSFLLADQVLFHLHTGSAA